MCGLFLGLCFLEFVASQNSFERATFHSLSGDSLPYRILVPSTYDSSQSYPLVLFLHGGGERGNDNEKQLLHGVGIFAQLQDQFPCVVVAPQCAEDSYWASVRFDRDTYPLQFDFNYTYPLTSGLDLAMQLLEEIKSAYSVDPAKIYITGLSMGGMGALEAAFRFPETFACVVAVCGGADLVAYDDWRDPIPTWLFHGDIDGVISVEHSRRLHRRLTSNFNNVIYTEYPGVNHNSWEDAYAEPQLVPWMFAQKRKH